MVMCKEFKKGSNEPFLNKKRAVFIDRDGTINKEKGYVHTFEEWEFIDGAIDALAIIKKKGYSIVVVTNQSGVARGYYKVSDVDKLHRKINQILINNSAGVDRFYLCPHHPLITGICNCRKPMPGLLLKAQCELDIDFRGSIMVGDKCSDILAGLKVGCKAVLVRTGYGFEEEKKLPPVDLDVCNDIFEFAVNLKPCE